MKNRLKILRYTDLQDKVAVVVGTRPGIIKMSPIIRELGQRNIDHFVIHTGQHYSPEMDQAFFEDLELASPRCHLKNVRECYFHGEQTAEMIRGVEQALLAERPKVVLVCGDANTNLAAGLAARKLRIIVGHVESGLRSYDWTMPEEHNRIILDHICELLFAPTAQACDNLVADNVRGEIHLTGNTIVDAVWQNLDIAKHKSDVLAKLELEPNRYVVCTFHREENVDVRSRLEAIVTGIKLVAEQLDLPIIFSAHPRTQKRLGEFGIDKAFVNNSRVRMIEPVGYLDFLMMLSQTRLVLTDSGGIQEESCILHVPCVTLRDNTERPETVEVGANCLAGVSPESILSAAQAMLAVQREWENPFGDGNAAQKIIDVVESVLRDGVILFDNSLGTRSATFDSEN